MPNENDPGSQTPETKTDDQKQTEALNNAVNAAVTAHLKRFGEKVLPGIIAEAMKPVGEQIAALKAAPPPEGETDTKAGKGKPDPQIAALSAMVEELKAANVRETEARTVAEKKARDDKAFSDLRNHLSGKVRPEFVDLIANDMFHIKKMVDVGEDGSVTFKGTKTQFGIAEEVAYPLGAGVDDWLKSDTAKAFLPAPGTASTTPQQRRQTVNPSQLPKDFNPETASPAQRIQHAEEMARDMADKLAQRGIKVS